ncbi:MAG: helix-turn-helix domain-containing protein [Bdellovibrionales bacterium]
MDKILEYELIKYSLLKTIRGQRTQMEMSKLLGFGFNQYHKWETGAKSLSLFDFFDLCNALNLPIDEMLRILLLFDSESVPEESFFKAAYEKLGPKNKDELSDLLGINKSSLYRWISGNGIMDLAVFFLWIDQRTQYLKDSIVCLVGLEKSEIILGSRDEDQLQRRHAYFKLPFMPAVQYFFDTTTYDKMEDKSIAEIANKTGLTIEEVSLSIAELLKMDIIRKDGDSYVNQLSTTNLGNINMVESSRMAKYWNQKVLDRYSTPDGVPINTGEKSNMWTFRIIPVPDELEAEIKNRFSICFSEVFELINSSDLKTDNVKAILFNYFNVQDSRP